MPGPTYAWTNIPSTDLDQDSPLTTTVLESYRKNQVHLKEILLGTGEYRGETPHVHDGREDGEIGAASSENILSDSAVSTGGAAYAWTTSGWTTNAANGFDTTTTAGHSSYQILYRQPAQSKAAFGTSGADIVIALYVKAQGTLPTAGELWFGLSDGSTSAYVAGCKGVIAFGSVTSAWKRFYMALSAKGGGAATDLRILLRNGTTAPNQKLWVTAVSANLGSSLTYWAPGMNESITAHVAWNYYSIGPPVFEKATSITNATAISGV